MTRSSVHRQLACVLLLVIASHAHADAPTIAVDRSLVVSGQGYFPVALRLTDERIAVVLRGGGPHISVHGRLDIVFSADEGKTWTKPTPVVDSPVDDRNPAVGQAADGTLVVAFFRVDRNETAARDNNDIGNPMSTWTTRSTDGGKTWSDPSRLDVSDVGWASPFGRMLTLPDGSMLMNLYGGRIRPAGRTAPKGDCSYVYRSADHGKTWLRLAQIGAVGFNETALLRLDSGKLLAALRSDDKAQNVSISSSDDGKSWSKPKPLTPANVHPADLLQLPDGQILLTTGYRAGPFGVRGVIGPADGAFDWNNAFVLLNDATTTDCGYPSNVLLKDGSVLTVYYEVGSKARPDWGTHCGALRYRAPEAR